MVNIHSAVGSSKISNQGPAQQKWVVGNEDPAAINPGQRIDPREVANLRKQAQEEALTQERIQGQDSIRRIELITGIGRKTKEVTIENTSFMLRTLKNFEQDCLSEVIETSERFKTNNNRVVFTPTSLNKIKVEALSHSLFMIDGKPIELVLGVSSEDYQTQIDVKKQLIVNMDGALIDHLFLKYEELSKEAYDGYAPKTQEEAKEVVDTIHKSGQDT